MLSLFVALVLALSLLVPQLYSKEVPSPAQVSEAPKEIVTVINQKPTPQTVTESAPVVTSPELPGRTDNAITERNIWLIVNEKRQEAGLPLLTLDERLNTAAQTKSDDMAARHYFAHADPDGNKAWPLVKAEGYDYRFIGENLALYFTDVETMMDAWMLSESHRKNILSDHYVDFGVGLTEGNYNGYDTVFVTTLFGQEL